jgi:hypothetical protein
MEEPIMGSKPTDHPLASLPTPPSYEPPRLERLGNWRAVTLQMSVPIFGGGFLPDPEQPSRLG